MSIKPALEAPAAQPLSLSFSFCSLPWAQGSPYNARVEGCQNQRKPLVSSQQQSSPQLILSDFRGQVCWESLCKQFHPILYHRLSNGLKYTNSVLVYLYFIFTHLAICCVIT